MEHCHPGMYDSGFLNKYDNLIRKEQKFPQKREFPGAMRESPGAMRESPGAMR
jgi:hypothetical protein